MVFFFKGVIFRFNTFIFRGFWYKGGISRYPPWNWQQFSLQIGLNAPKGKKNHWNQLEPSIFRCVPWVFRGRVFKFCFRFLEVVCLCHPCFSQNPGDQSQRGWFSLSRQVTSWSLPFLLEGHQQLNLWFDWKGHFFNIPKKKVTIAAEWPSEFFWCVFFNCGAWIFECVNRD